MGPPLQPGSGEELEVPPLVPAASTEAMVDAPIAPLPIPGESVPAPPSWAISLHVPSTVDYWICWALDPWWITEVLNLVHRGPKKWTSTKSMRH